MIPMKTYNQTVEELFDLQKFSIKMGLDNINALAESMGNPHLAYPVLHVAGTNGKGSTSMMIQHILSAHGLKTGVYTSPHLVDFRERIRVNDRLVDEPFVIDFWKRISRLVIERQATFFDATTAMAFDYFKREGVDVAVIETGLGGRLDSTNLVQPEAVILTPIGMDHTKQLGRNLRSIAREKANIIKKGAWVFSSRQDKPAREVIDAYLHLAAGYLYIPESTKASAAIYERTICRFDLTDRVRHLRFQGITLGVPGQFQVENALLAYQVSRWYLEKREIPFSEEKFRSALAAFRWSGRLQQVSVQPEIYLDVSHNYSGFKRTIKFVRGIATTEHRHLLIGLLNDKPYKQIARLLRNEFKEVTIVEPVNERALPAETLKAVFNIYWDRVRVEKSVQDAYRVAVGAMRKNDVLFVMGSHFLVSEILKVLHKST